MPNGKNGKIGPPEPPCTIRLSHWAVAVYNHFSTTVLRTDGGEIGRQFRKNLDCRFYTRR